jgi:hypothetical protein
VVPHHSTQLSPGFVTILCFAETTMQSLCQQHTAVIGVTCLPHASGTVCFLCAAGTGRGVAPGCLAAWPWQSAAAPPHVCISPPSCTCSLQIQKTRIQGPTCAPSSIRSSNSL